MTNTKNTAGKHRASADQEIVNAAMRTLVNRAIDHTSTVEVFTAVDSLPADAQATVYRALQD